MIRFLFVPKGEYGIRFEKKISGGNVCLLKESDQRNELISFTVDTNKVSCLKSAIYKEYKSGIRYSMVPNQEEYTVLRVLVLILSISMSFSEVTEQEERFGSECEEVSEL